LLLFGLLLRYTRLTRSTPQGGPVAINFCRLSHAIIVSLILKFISPPRRALHICFMCSKPFLSPPLAVGWKSRAVQRAHGKCFGKSLAAKQTDSEKRSQNLGKTLTRPWERRERHCEK